MQKSFTFLQKNFDEPIRTQNKKYKYTHSRIILRKFYPKRITVVLFSNHEFVLFHPM